MDKNLQSLEELKRITMNLVKSKKKFIKLSDRRSGMRYQSNTPKAIDNAEANFNF